MRISIAGLLFVIAFILVACVHETTVFHSPTGRNYFKESSGEVASAPPAAVSPIPEGESAPPR